MNNGRTGTITTKHYGPNGVIIDLNGIGSFLDQKDVFKTHQAVDEINEDVIYLTRSYGSLHKEPYKWPKYLVIDSLDDKPRLGLITYLYKRPTKKIEFIKLDNCK